MTELQIVFEQLDKACCPEDVFGKNPAMVGHLFRDFTKVVHPDLHGNSELSNQAFQVLNDLKSEADQRIKSGTWGNRFPLAKCAPIPIGAFMAKPRPIVGDIADVYSVVGKSQVIKVARHADDNDLLRAEAAVLPILRRTVPLPILNGLPVLLSHFQIDGVWKREANVLSTVSGFITAEAVHSKMPSLDGRTAVWIFKRILALLGWVHQAGYIHGAILPQHVLLYPDNDGHYPIDPRARDVRKHSIRLIDWCYAVDFRQRTRLSSWVPDYMAYYPPEIVAKSSLDETADFYMAAKLIQLLSNNLPGELDAVLDRCMDKNPKRRYRKAADVLDSWTKAARAVYGSPRWVDFFLPN